MNPYAPPKTANDHSSRVRPRLADRAVWGVAGLLAGGIAGRFTGFLVWNYVYSIGSRVVSDKTHIALEDDVVMWSTIIGVGTGFLIGSLLTRRCIPVLISQYLTGLLTGCMCAHTGWQEALYGLGIGQIIAVVSATVVVTVFRSTKSSTEALH